MVVYVFELVHLDNLFMIVYVIENIGGNENYQYSIKEMVNYYYLL